jgi:hypothetical protein
MGDDDVRRRLRLAVKQVAIYIAISTSVRGRRGEVEFLEPRTVE